MKTHSFTFSLILSMFLFNIGDLQAQQTTHLESGYTNFDKIVGLQNTSLYQGRLYTERYRTINEKKQFFKSPDFLNGEVWYKGQPYFGQRLKYDVYDDELVLKLEDNGNTLKLSKKDVDSFSVQTFNSQKNHFVNLKADEKTKDQPSGFYEVLFQDPMFVLYAKHGKKMVERKDKKYIYHEFRDVNTEHLLLYKGAYYAFDSKNDIIDVFPNHKNEINQLYKRAKTLSNNDDTVLATLIVKQLNSIL